MLATSAYCEDIDVFFIGAGVTQLLPVQQPETILSRDYISAFKLLDLYEIDNIYTCQSSLNDYQINSASLLIENSALSQVEMVEKLQLCQKILTF